MDSTELTSALEQHLRAQLTLAESCRDRTMAVRDPRLKSAWIGHFVRVSNAMAITGSALARIIHVKGDAAILNLASFRLPSLPALPEGEGYPPLPEFRKTTPGGISSGISELERCAFSSFSVLRGRCRA